jgi:hypothetical protein
LPRRSPTGEGGLIAASFGLASRSALGLRGFALASRLVGTMPSLGFVLALLLAGVSSSILAADIDEIESPQALTPAQDDAKFVAYAQPVIAFTHAEIIDGTGARPKSDQTLVIERGRIAAFGPSSRIRVSTP